MLKTSLLRTFALIVSAHPYCARKFACHAIHRARTIRPMATGIALPGFNDFGRSVTHFLLIDHFLPIFARTSLRDYKNIKRVKLVKISLDVRSP